MEKAQLARDVASEKLQNAEQKLKSAEEAFIAAKKPNTKLNTPGFSRRIIMSNFMIQHTVIVAHKRRQANVEDLKKVKANAEQRLLEVNKDLVELHKSDPNWETSANEVDRQLKRKVVAAALVDGQRRLAREKVAFMVNMENKQKEFEQVDEKLEQDTARRRKDEPTDKLEEMVNMARKAISLLDAEREELENQLNGHQWDYNNLFERLRKKREMELLRLEMEWNEELQAAQAAAEQKKRGPLERMQPIKDLLDSYIAKMNDPKHKEEAETQIRVLSKELEDAQKEFNEAQAELFKTESAISGKRTEAKGWVPEGLRRNFEDVRLQITQVENALRKIYATLREKRSFVQKDEKVVEENRGKNYDAYDISTESRSTISIQRTVLKKRAAIVDDQLVALEEKLKELTVNSSEKPASDAFSKEMEEQLIRLAVKMHETEFVVDAAKVQVLYNQNRIEQDRERHEQNVRDKEMFEVDNQEERSRLEEEWKGKLETAEDMAKKKKSDPLWKLDVIRGELDRYKNELNNPDKKEEAERQIRILSEEIEEAELQIEYADDDLNGVKAEIVQSRKEADDYQKQRLSEIQSKIDEYLNFQHELLKWSEKVKEAEKELTRINKEIETIEKKNK
ncbi:hypothetical protein QR680_014479 [Steinernema hermaphroditum]|uniref:Uncharacterized protein n=1 Tax=Steinernema hermaphroditum TaxID=289476 RepID=A0AA39IBA8_9BILA|nr:hypothetical protein QR680_014479 [Steinernema hermaphroditum]